MAGSSFYLIEPEDPHPLTSIRWRAPMEAPFTGAVAADLDVALGGRVGLALEEQAVGARLEADDDPAVRVRPRLALAGQHVAALRVPEEEGDRGERLGGRRVDGLLGGGDLGVVLGHPAGGRVALVEELAAAAAAWLTTTRTATPSA